MWVKEWIAPLMKNWDHVCVIPLWITHVIKCEITHLCFYMGLNHQALIHEWKIFKMIRFYILVVVFFNILSKAGERNFQTDRVILLRVVSASEKLHPYPSCQHLRNCIPTPPVSIWETASLPLPKLNINPLTPRSDSHKTSPYNIQTFFSKQVMRIFKLVR